MTTLYIEGKERTAQFADWTLRYNNEKKYLELTGHFHSGKSYTWPFSQCRVEPTTPAAGTLLLKKGQPAVRTIDHAVIVGNKYALVYYPDNEKCYVMKSNEVDFISAGTAKKGTVFGYFREVARQRLAHASDDKQPIAENIVRQIDKIVAHPDSVLEAYCNASNLRRQKPEQLIYPFGLNESQMKAVEQAFSTQISVIEGPPGTGKTQTILNILANILIQGRSVAVVSNNNTAVDNVCEKLAKVGLDHVVARLGSADNRQKFFATPPPLPEAAMVTAPDISTITEQATRLKDYLRAQNNVAQLRAEIDELSIEQKYLSQWLHTQRITDLPDVERYRLSQQTITDLMAFIQSIGTERPGWRERLTLLLRYRIFNIQPLNSMIKRQAMFFALQRHYYDARLRQASEALAKSEQILNDNDVYSLQQQLTENSLTFLRAHLQQALVDAPDLNEANYQKDFAAFLQRYPVISSSTHSIINSLAPGTLLDYVIIDEASQQDIVPGILAFACARNVIVVGDRKQLTHIPEKIAVPAPAPHYDCLSTSLLDSLPALYGDRLPMTLLKEHYRCHPKIIQFCNKQFYDNQLIAMTRDAGEPALSLVMTAKGNHMRHHSRILCPGSWLLPAHVM